MKRAVYCVLLAVFCGDALAQDLKNLVPHRVTVNYPEHVVTAEVNPVEHRVKTELDRFYFWYAGNSIQQTQGGFSGKLLNGKYVDIYLTKNLRESGFFKDGLKSGNWMNWYENGRLKDLVGYVGGLKEKRYFRYDTAGIMVESGVYKAGKLNGKQVVFEGGKQTITMYKAGKAQQPKVKKKNISLFNRLMKKAGSYFKKNKAQGA
ncbi:hypothetical protein GS399_05415 [Pedobacter sp. HMF7647]|uniref:Toxin-antitoxin system YwqK family antitoxin n=1 Tax=Hufsiella arboris TaxID=2695275 RepID=A0A7K1Y760_9SPHI|nr:hypothetical protein [Hufsiella arboris]MXV50404.1 hypothetical protein [Hufsiella arboris]